MDSSISSAGLDNKTLAAATASETSTAPSSEAAAMASPEPMPVKSIVDAPSPVDLSEEASTIGRRMIQQQPTQEVESILSHLRVPRSPITMAHPSHACTTLQLLTADASDSWRATDPVAQILASSSILSRRPGRWSNRFRVAPALAFVKSQRSSVARAAFDAAALSVLRALVMRLAAESEVLDAVDDVGLKALDSLSESPSSSTALLPPIFDALDSIAASRDRAIDTVLGRNPEEVGSGDCGKGPAEVAATKGQSVSLAQDGAMSDRTSSPRKQTRPEAISSAADAVLSSAPKVEFKSPSSSSPAKAKAPEGAVLTSGGGGPSAKSTASEADAGKTPTGIDSRSTAARAILCAAASLTFEKVTPDYIFEGLQVNTYLSEKEDSHERMRGNGKIDVLDIPQNTHTVTAVAGDIGADSAAFSPNMDASEAASAKTDTTTSARTPINMGAVMMQAKIHADRAIRRAHDASRRSDARSKWRSSCAKRFHTVSKAEFDSRSAEGESDGASSLTSPMQSILLGLRNPFALHHDSGKASLATNWVSDDDDEAFARIPSESVFDPLALSESKTDTWSKACLPRLLSIMEVGAGHAIMHDLEWEGRAGRTADLLLAADARGLGKAGPHLVITTQADIDKFRAVFQPAKIGLVPPPKDNKLSPVAIVYDGSPAHRRGLRMRYFATLHNVSFARTSCDTSSPPPHFDVILTTYAAFIADYAHFTRIPFHIVILDDGASWLGVADADPNGNLGKVYESGMWSRVNNHGGGAGVGIGAGGVGDTADPSLWDFECDDGNAATSTIRNSDKKEGKEAFKAADGSTPTLLLGLTSRHRIILARTLVSTLVSTQSEVHFKLSVPSLLSFLIPQLFSVIREEWDRSRLHQCEESLAHIRKLICRSIVVHPGSSSASASAQIECNLMALAMDSLCGKSLLCDSVEKSINSVKSEDDFFFDMVTSNHISQSRRNASIWLRPGSSIREELASTCLEPILGAIASRHAAGYVCEEIVTASSLTPSGAGGFVVGPAAYKMAVRCGRTFGSEQGLRQHATSMHAPPGTWLCRTCGEDCSTSQARTQHERTCGLIHESPSGSGHVNLSGGIPTVGQGKGKKGGTGGGKARTGSLPRDKDGSFRVPRFRGVWVSNAGKHFVKVGDKRLTESDFNTEEIEEGGVDAPSGAIKFFDSAEDAGKAHDEIAKKIGTSSSNVELNFNPDGSRIIYDDKHAAPGGMEVLGPGTSSVVPALSIINIRDLPPHVKPLLRDPRQTSRIGGQQKRHVYAYRGVCRQSRKGHDRWQSQISFAGTNHYLGTFDSEWDASAIYAWAHLILYGEEATRKAQKEGEEAAAAYEQEKKDIAAGITPLIAKLEKRKEKQAAKKKKPKKKEAKESKKRKSGDMRTKNAKKEAASATAASKKRKQHDMDDNATSSTAANEVADAVELGPEVNVAKAAPIFSRRKELADKNDAALVQEVSNRIVSIRDRRLNETVASALVRKVRAWSVCVPVKDFSADPPSGSAMLVGLDPSDFDWKVETFIDQLETDEQLLNKAIQPRAINALKSEFSVDGVNARFRTVLQAPVCNIGRVGRDLEAASERFGLGPVELLGGSVGHIECNIGGLRKSCSQIAARVTFCPTTVSDYQIHALGDESDVVTLNGTRINSESGPFPLKDQDVCSVGARVFMFLLAPSK